MQSCDAASSRKTSVVVRPLCFSPRRGGDFNHDTTWLQCGAPDTGPGQVDTRCWYSQEPISGMGCRPAICARYGTSSSIMMDHSVQLRTRVGVELRMEHQNESGCVTLTWSRNATAPHRVLHPEAMSSDQCIQWLHDHHIVISTRDSERVNACLTKQ